MVRLVFRPYTQIRRSICTSESLRASTKVSFGFALFRHSSPSFGSQHTSLTQTFFSKEHGRLMVRPKRPTTSLSFRAPVFHRRTRSHIRLLGPCFKTGSTAGFRQPASWARPEPREKPEGNPRGTTPTPRRALTYDRAQAPTSRDRRKMHGHHHSCCTVPSYRFQALFNSLFKVLCIFPSRYLFAIGLPPIFSLRWNLPPL